MNDNLYVVLCNLNEFGMIGNYEDCKKFFNFMRKYYNVMYLAKIVEVKYNENPKNKESISIDYEKEDKYYPGYESVDDDGIPPEVDGITDYFI